VQPERGGFLAAGAASRDVGALMRAESALRVDVLAFEASAGFTGNRS
jgi:hypothetical protein